MYDLRHFIHDVESTLANHNLGLPGAYRRSNQAGAKRTTDLTPYGCADAANILYSVGRFPGDPLERQTWVTTLQGLQDPETGLFQDPDHPPVVASAHALGALELFDARPRAPLKDLSSLKKTHEMVAYLDSLNWRGSPAGEAHRGSGMYTALALAGETTLDWEERYFTWLWDETDPHTGMWRRGRIEQLPDGSDASPLPHLQATFAYLTTLEYARRPLHFPEKLVDTCMGLSQEAAVQLGERFSHNELAWVYCLNRAERQSGHRFTQVRHILERFAVRYISFLKEVDPETDPGFNDLHLLASVVCTLAELQHTLPGQIRTARPLRLVLDRRPGL